MGRPEMMALDAPKMTPLIVPELPPRSAPAKPLIPAVKRQSGTSAQKPAGTRTQRPKKAGKKPPAIPDHTWRSNGAGWDLRGNEYRDGKRKRPYVGHLSKSAYAEMRRKFKGAALDSELQRWAEQQKGER